MASPDPSKRRTGTIDRGADGRIQPFKKTQQQCQEVEALAALGTPHADLVLLIEWGRGGPISEKTLRRHFRIELARGKARATARIARKMFEQAVDGHFGSQLFWLKCQGGWKETQVIEQVGKDGKPLAQPVFYLPVKDAIPDDATVKQSLPRPTPTVERLAVREERPSVLARSPRASPADDAIENAAAAGRVEPMNEHIERRFRI